ncbi:MAG: hypothetical protein ACHREM_15785 [Polyangiales bacterium]
MTGTEDVQIRPGSHVELVVGGEIVGMIGIAPDVSRALHASIIPPRATDSGHHRVAARGWPIDDLDDSVERWCALRAEGAIEPSVVLRLVKDVVPELAVRLGDVSIREADGSLGRYSLGFETIEAIMRTLDVAVVEALDRAIDSGTLDDVAVALHAELLAVLAEGGVILVRRGGQRVGWLRCTVAPGARPTIELVTEVGARASRR